MKFHQRFIQTIYSPTNQFTYDDANVSGGFTDTTTRTTGTAKYVITFESNDFTYADGHTTQSHLIAKGATAKATDLIGNTITGSPDFQGWHTLTQNIDGSAQTGDVKVGGSGTYVIVTPDAGNATKYVIKGDAGSAAIISNTNSYELHPHWSAVPIKLPGATRNEANTGNGQKADLFIGWFTKPQPSNGGSGNGGKFIGRAGQVVNVTSDMTLYPWFNIAPTIIESDMPNKFWEGQQVSYRELLSLIDATDIDDPSSNAVNNEITWNGTHSWFEYYHALADVYVQVAYPTYSEEQRKAIIDAVNYADFTPVIKSISYECNGLDSDGKACSDGALKNQTFTSDAYTSNPMLDTSLSKVGKVIIHYEISDHGIKSNGALLSNSPITVGFDLKTEIKYNVPPTLELRSTYIFSEDSNNTSAAITNFLRAKQITDDTEDCHISNGAWWDIAVTSENLKNSLYITKVSDITFNHSYYIEHEADCEEVMAITNLDDLYRLRNESPELFSHITNYKVTFDCEDQWGKQASDARLGQDDVSRTIEVVMFNNKDDADLMDSFVSEKLRYIGGFTPEMNLIRMPVDGQDILKDFKAEDSYWSRSGYNELMGTFEKYNKKEDADKDAYTGTVTSGSEQDIPITVNDYSN